MTTTAIIDLLQKLSTLTSEREPLALEFALINTIAHLSGQDSVALYHLTGQDHDEVSVINFDGHQANHELADAFKFQLIDSFKFAKEKKLAQPESTLSTFLYPIKNNENHITAVVGVTVENNALEIDLTIKSLLQIYQNYTNLINENERDTLTGMLNRKTFETKINKVFSSLISQNGRKADNVHQKNYLAIFDIDHFKRVNDEFGHLIGDEVLLLFSRLMTNTFREQDMLFRFGGEEFVGVFECPSIADIERAVNRFREKVSMFNFPQIGTVTVSVGFTELSLHDTSSILIDRADAALYYAKNNGRNCAHNYEQLVADGRLQENKVDSDFELF